MNQLPAIPIGLLVVVLYALFWCGLMVMIGRGTGWIALGQRYHIKSKFEGKCWRFQHAQFRWGMNYSGALTVGANAEGLYVSTWPIFRLGHPSLFIPWSETRIEMKHSRWLGNYMEIQFPNVPRTCIRFHEKLAKRIAAVVGPQLARSNNPDQPHAPAV